MPAKALEPAGQVPDPQPRQPAGVNVGAVRQQQPAHGPVDHRHPASKITRSEHQVRPLDGLEKLLQVRGIVREVSVHLEEVVVAALESPTKRGPVGRAESQLLLPVQHVDPGVGPGELVGDAAGPVLGVVVHDQHVDPRVLRQDLRQEIGEVRRLVVRRNDDEGSLSHAASAAKAGAPPAPGPAPAATATWPSGRCGSRASRTPGRSPGRPPAPGP